MLTIYTSYHIWCCWLYICFRRWSSLQPLSVSSKWNDLLWFGSVSYQFVAQKLPRKAKVALGCWYYKELLKTLKVAQKLPSTIYLCLIVVGFEFAVPQRNVKEWHERWTYVRVLKESNKSRFASCSVRNSILIISHITFRDCRAHIFSDNLSQNSCIWNNMKTSIVEYKHFLNS